MRERDWLVPSTILTQLSCLLGIALIPSYSGVLPAVAMIPWWMLVAGIVAGVYSFTTMVAAGVDSPLAHIRDYCTRERRLVALVTFGLFLAGLNMTTFMWVKPLLNYLVPFWADPLLADMDKALFLGRDPWTMLTWLNSSAMALFYHRGWFALMIITLLVVLRAPASAEKSALMLTYFFLWSVAGPLIHVLLPAGGPIFYAQLGYGDRFEGLGAVAETREVADYLWGIYAGSGFAPGSGISAMPSLHIATATWMMLAIYTLARHWAAAMAAAVLLTFLLSISLGWHYAVDGIVGGACAIAAYRLFRAFYRGPRGWSVPRWRVKPAS